MACFLLLVFVSAAMAIFDVSNATVSCRNRPLACSLLVEQVFERAQKRWTLTSSCEAASSFCIVLTSGNDTSSEEAFKLSFLGPQVLSVAGESPMGLLYGVGKLLRSLELSIVRRFGSESRRVMVLDPALLDLGVRQAPLVPVRAVKFGYDAGGSSSTCWWSIDNLERLVVQLALLGMNELSYDGLDGSRVDDDSPCFRQDPDTCVLC